MGLNKYKIVSTVEYGSRFQGNSDDYSDYDYMNLVIQPLSNSIFTTCKNGVTHIDDDRYYSLEKFITMLEKPSNDTFILLSAQLHEGGENIVNKYVLNDFYKEEKLESYMRVNLPRLLYSLLGQSNKLLTKDSFTGKDEVNLHILYKKLLCYTSSDEVLKYDDVEFMKFGEADEWFLMNKRGHSSLHSRIYWKVKLEEIEPKVHKKIKEVKDKLQEEPIYIDTHKLLLKDLRDKATEFIVKENIDVRLRDF